MEQHGSLTADDREDRHVTLDEIRAAAHRVSPYLRPSPVVHVLSGPSFKAESLMPTGSFKVRGAFNSMLLMSEQQRRCGVVAHSSGNHAQAVAYAARVLGVRATIVMPDNAPRKKLEATRRLGCDVVVVGPSSIERACKATALANEYGWKLIEPYDSFEILAATGTIGLEILASLPSVDTIFVPISGGGLIGGLASAVKQARNTVRVVGAEPECAAHARASLQAGRIVEFSAEQTAKTIADGLRVQRLGRRNWHAIRSFVDEIVTVGEREIVTAMRFIANEAHLIAEPSGAVALAAAMKNPTGSASIAIVSGGNVETSYLAEVLSPKVEY